MIHAHIDDPRRRGDELVDVDVDDPTARRRRRDRRRLAEADTRPCAYCGRPVPQRASAGRPFRYCRDNDDQCLRAARNARMRQRNAPGLAGQVAQAFEVVDRLDRVVETLTEALHTELSPAGVERQLISMRADTAAQLAAVLAERDEARREAEERNAVAARATRRAATGTGGERPGGRGRAGRGAGRPGAGRRGGRPGRRAGRRRPGRDRGRPPEPRPTRCTGPGRPWPSATRPAAAAAAAEALRAEALRERDAAREATARTERARDEAADRGTAARGRGAGGDRPGRGGGGRDRPGTGRRPSTPPPRPQAAAAEAAERVRRLQDGSARGRAARRRPRRRALATAEADRDAARADADAARRETAEARQEAAAARAHADRLAEQVGQLAAALARLAPTGRTWMIARAAGHPRSRTKTKCGPIGGDLELLAPHGEAVPQVEGRAPRCARCTTPGAPRGGPPRPRRPRSSSPPSPRLRCSGRVAMPRNRQAGGAVERLGEERDAGDDRAVARPGRRGGRSPGGRPRRTSRSRPEGSGAAPRAGREGSRPGSPARSRPAQSAPADSASAKNSPAALTGHITARDVDHLLALRKRSLHLMRRLPARHQGIVRRSLVVTPTDSPSRPGGKPIMGERMLRGSRLGAVSYESDRNTELAPRQTREYLCARGHQFEVPFAVDAEVPDRPGSASSTARVARLVDGNEPEQKKAKPPRTHWDMLLERRSMAELDDILNERLEEVRARRGRAS